MCDYCDCRSQPEIEALSEEHAAILGVVAAVRRETSSGRSDHVDEHVRELEALLTQHTEREERGVFARLRAADVAEEYVGRFLHDHEEIDRLLHLAETDHSVIGALLDLLSRHIVDEETDTYPAARQVLGPTDWDAVDAAVADLQHGSATAAMSSDGPAR